MSLLHLYLLFFLIPVVLDESGRFLPSVSSPWSSGHLRRSCEDSELSPSRHAREANLLPSGQGTCWPPASCRARAPPSSNCGPESLVPSHRSASLMKRAIRTSHPPLSGHPPRCLLPAELEGIATVGWHWRGTPVPAPSPESSMSALAGGELRQVIPAAEGGSPHRVPATRQAFRSTECLGRICP